MQLTNRITLVVCGAAALVLVSMTVAQAPSKDGQKPLAPQFAPDGMQRWMEVNKTDHHHQKLGEWLGTWNTEMKMYMGGPGSEPSVSKGTATFSWLVENRWLRQEVEGDLDLGGMKLKVKTFGTMGFDRYKQKYVGMAIDSMTTDMRPFEGNFDATDKTLILWGPMDEPMSGEHDKTVKYVWRLPAPDKLVYEVHDMSIGEANTKVVEITYSRAK